LVETLAHIPFYRKRKPFYRKRKPARVKVPWTEQTVSTRPECAGFRDFAHGCDRPRVAHGVFDAHEADKQPHVC
jgi:hypothetical protein